VGLLAGGLLAACEAVDAGFEGAAGAVFFAAALPAERVWMVSSF